MAAIIVLARLENQEAKVGEFISAVNRFCQVFSDTMECYKETMKSVNVELAASRRERVEQNKKFTDLMSIIREDYAVQITRVNDMVVKLEEIQESLQFEGEDDERGDRTYGK